MDVIVDPESIGILMVLVWYCDAGVRAHVGAAQGAAVRAWQDVWMRAVSVQDYGQKENAGPRADAHRTEGPRVRSVP